ncbi:MAG: hypothetical protein OXF54_19905 [Caldilineaceae bacterium]|nr:hypothetical protein [Caldilineaceae bacterium]
MFHRKRFKSAIAIILTLLLVAALAPVASAQNGGDVGDNPPPPGITPDPAPTDPPPPPGPTATPTATSDNGMQPPPPSPTATATATATPDNGMMNGDKDMMGPPSSHSWPPPNAIVRHAATPVQISAHGGALNVYIIAPDGAVTSGPALASFSDLAEMHAMGGAVELYSGVNAGSGKSILIEYLPDEMKIRVSTYYADKPPHDYNKPYVFTVDADHSVTHERW